MPIEIFKLIGILGLILLISGVLIKSEKRKLRNIIYIMGGIALTIYSIYIEDLIFISLQIIFIIVTIYDLTKLRKK
jgi:uncharacterized membrane protein